MADRIFLTNDSVSGTSPTGYNFDEEVLQYSFISETSVHGNSGTGFTLGAAPKNGRIVDVYIGVVRPAVSASGFVSADITATVKINNSTAVCSVNPSIVGPVGSAGLAVRKFTNTGGGVSAVVNAASASFSAGDTITFDYDAKSVGSAAAGQTGTGFYIGVKVRYAAR